MASWLSRWRCVNGKTELHEALHPLAVNCRCDSGACGIDDFFVWDLVDKQARFLAEEVEQSTRHYTETLAQSMALWAASGDYQAVQDVVNTALVRQPHIKAMVVIDSDGRVIAHSDPEKLGLYVQDDLSLKLLKMKSPETVVLKQTQAWIDVASPVLIGSRLIGWVRLQKDISYLARQSEAVWWEGGMYTLFAIIVGALFAWYLGTGLTRRLTALMRFTERVAKGDRTGQVPINPSFRDEVTELGEHFQKMLDQLIEQECYTLRERDRLNSILGVLPESVVELDAQGRIVYVNSMFEQMVHHTAAQLYGKPIEEVIEVLTEKGYPLWPDKHPTERDARRLVVRVKPKKAPIEEENMFLRVVPREAQDGALYYVLLFEYYADSQHLIEELRWQRDHDVLTRVYNRQALERHLLDLFELKQPMILAQFLMQRVGQQAFVARLGGDDFVIVWKAAQAEDVYKKCNQIKSLLSEVEHYPFRYGERIFTLSMHAGVLDVSAERVGSAEEALLKLDYALRQAKRQGDGQCVIYDDRLMDTQEKFAEIGWLTEIKQGLQEDRFVLYAQPVVALQHSNKRTIEVLVRLVDRQGEHVAPYHFLPVAERFGLMGVLDLHIVRKTLTWLTSHHAAYDQVNINLSGIMLQQANSRHELLHLVQQQSEAVREKICFEVTETAAVYDLEETAQFLNDLRALKCKIAVDDFGSGYASFNYLKHLPVDFVKIDGAFVRDLLSDRVSYAMVKAITHVAHEMGLQVVAEFVETAEIARILAQLDIEFAQGYLFSPPCPIEKIPASVWEITLTEQ